MDDKKKQEKINAFFAMLAKYGVKEAIMINPPEGAEPVAKIQPNGDLMATDKRDGKQKKITPR